MHKLTANDPETRSADIVADNLSKLQSLFPEAFAESKVQFDVLKQLLGGAIDDADEKYGLNWHGKRRARKIALAPSIGTLMPCLESSSNSGKTNNLFLEGDNLEVLKLIQKTYSGKVKLIYIDPPYNTGKDFVYKDDYRNGVRNYLELTGQSENGRRISTNAETSGRFHSDWLSMMYPRLKLARSLLTQDGVIFISLDDTEISNMRLIMDELFGTECFVGSVAWKKRSSPDARDTLGSVHDWILVYVKNADLIKSSIGKMPLSQGRVESYSNPDNDPRGPWASVDMTGMTGRATAEQYFEVTSPTGKSFKPPEGRAWGLSKETYESMLSDNRIWFGKAGNAVPRMKRFLSESDGQVVPSFWGMDEVGSNEEAKKEVNKLFGMADVFDTPKPVRLIRRMIDIATRKGEEHIVMDFFAGSGTTGHAVLAHNNEAKDNLSFILVQLPEVIDSSVKAQAAAAKYCNQMGLPSNISELAKARLRLAIESIGIDDAGFNVFKLAESNFKPWIEAPPDDLAGSIINLEDNIKDSATESSLMYEVMLKVGVSMTTPHTKRDISGFKVVSVGGGVLYFCLVNSIDSSAIEGLAEAVIRWRSEEKPAVMSRIYVRGGAFANDVDLLNFSLIFEQSGEFEVIGL